MKSLCKEVSEAGLYSQKFKNHLLQLSFEVILLGDITE